MPANSNMHKKSMPELAKRGRVLEFRSMSEAQSFIDSLDPEDMMSYEWEVLVSGLPSDAPHDSEDHYRLWVRPDGQVQFFGLPSQVHEVAHGTFSSQLAFAFGAISMEMCEDGLFLNSTRCLTHPGSKEADFAFRPFSLGCPPALPYGLHDSPYPTLVLEVAYMCESLQRLEQELEVWLGPATSVQVALGLLIRVMKNRKVHLLLINKSRHGQEERILFGTEESALATPLLKIPISSLYWGTKWATMFPDQLIEIDLNLIRRNIVSAIEMTRRRR